MSENNGCSSVVYRLCTPENKTSYCSLKRNHFLWDLLKKCNYTNLVCIADVWVRNRCAFWQHIWGAGIINLSKGLCTKIFHWVSFHHLPILCQREDTKRKLKGSSLYSYQNLKRLCYTHLSSSHIFKFNWSSKSLAVEKWNLL